MNAPGSDCIVGAPGLDSETWEGGAGVPEPTCDDNTGLENIFVNSPGPDLGAAGGGAAATGALEGGALAAGETGLENIRVNSPGPDCAMDAPEPGAPGLDSETGESGAGTDETGLLAAGAGAGTNSLDALAPIELNMRVKAPGAAGSACGAGADAGEAGLPCDIEIPTVASFDGFSIATGLKTRATSFVRPISGTLNPAFGAAFDPAFPLGTVSACSMRVNSPGLRDASVPAAGAGAASFTGSALPGAAAVGAAAPAAFSASASAAFFSGAACPSSEASKSSSARGAVGTCPKTPVALDGRSVLCESGGSNVLLGVLLGASMRGHLA